LSEYNLDHPKHYNILTFQAGDMILFIPVPMGYF